MLGRVALIGTGQRYYASSGPVKNQHWRLATYADLLVICLREITLAVEDHSGNSADGQDIGYASAELETITSSKGSFGTILIVFSTGLKRTDQQQQGDG